MFRHYRIILRELVINALPSYTSISNAPVGNKGKAVPLQARGGPEDSRKLRFPDFVTTAQDGGQFVSPTHRPPLSTGNAPGTHFC